ncbi:MAG: OmpA family protein [Prevotellaceae bacterium]|jgi:peptidoglycan-associated lipoprotein|nr:OmpA family protein [Prevotellaceae bacterium]
MKSRNFNIITVKKNLEILKLLLCILALCVLAGCSLEQQLAKADKLYSDGAYFQVEKKYRKLFRKINKKDKKRKAEIAYKIGECNRILFNTKKAVNSYNSAIRYNFSDSTIFLNIAKSYKILGNYDQASKNYSLFLTKNSLNSEALAGLSSCAQAREMLKNPTRYKVRPATEFNSRKSSDICPAFIGSDGNSILFTSNRDVSKKQKTSVITGKFNYDIYTSKKNKDGKWEKPQYLKEFNTSDDDGTTTVTADGREIYFTRCWAEAGQTRGGEIMSAVRSGGQWAEPQPVILFKDSSITAAHPAISPDGKYLYFVSDNKSGFGGKDIYISEKNGEEWNAPENLGEKINTSGNEMFPSFSPDGTLYFASDGHQGFGGLDIFSAKKDSLGKWVVENLLPPLNSSFDDFGITFAQSGKEGYFTSNRGNGKALDKIYYFELPEFAYVVEGKITDENGNQLSDAIVKLVGNDGNIVKQRVKKDGTYRIKLSKDVNYVMLASNRGYLNSSEKVTTLNEKNSKTYNKNFRLPSISKPVKMENIFYEFAKWNITPESELELNNLVKLLNDNPNITIEISAHTDMIGSDAANTELSQKRAQSVVNYLIKAGIAADRLTAKGYGKNRPVVVDSNLAKKYSFLKESDVLDSQFVEALPKEQQETANQINRRTEFRVLRTTYGLY